MLKFLQNLLKSNSSWSVGVVLFLLSFLLLSVNINKPFYGEHDWNGARYGNIARNYVRYGYAETKLGQVGNSGLAETYEFEYFTHYPPLLPILISLSYIIFGIAEWSTRLVPILATAGTIVLIYIIGRLIFNFRVGLFASSLVLITPQVLYFGKNPVHEPLVVFFILLSFLGFFKKNNVLFYTGLILAEMTTWAGYFVVPALTIYALFKKDIKELTRLKGIWIISLLVLLLHISHTYILTGNFFGGDLIGVLLERSAISESGRVEGLTIFGYLNRLRVWLTTLYSLPLILLAICGFILTIKKNPKKVLHLLAFLIFGSCYFILFPNSTFIHNYLTFYLLPFIGLSAGIMLYKICSLKRIGLSRYLFATVIMIIVFFDRFGYLKALHASSADKLAWEIGISINRMSKEDDHIIILPREYSYSAENFLKFYSDRKLVFQDIKDIEVKIIVKVNIDKGIYQIIK